MPTGVVVAGADVGGPKKGFHAVALRGGKCHDKTKAVTAAEIATWCQQLGAMVIGIDAPCGWSATGRMRAAERAMAAERIFCFATPAEVNASAKDFYRWMIAGAQLYKALLPTHSLYVGGAITGPICFETFPQAVACALAGEIVSAKQKRRVRRELLQRAGIDDSNLNNIDEVDAALCALTAHHVRLGKFKTYGDRSEGLIVVPPLFEPIRHV